MNKKFEEFKKLANLTGEEIGEQEEEVKMNFIEKRLDYKKRYIRKGVMLSKK